MKAKNTMFFIAILLILTSGVYIIRDNKKVVHIMQSNIVENKIDIIDRENYTSIISGIIDISNVYWSDENTIHFKGIKVGETNHKTFSFNVKKKELRVISQKKLFSKEINNRDSNEIVLTNIDDNKKLVYKKENKNHGLFYIKNNVEQSKIANNIEYNNKLIFKLSRNNEKLAFYDSELEKIRIYTLNSKKIVDIDFETSEYILNNFDDALQFSWEAGYFFLSDINDENINESSFSVFGADSGKLYGDSILGINPTWANANLSIAFIYSKNNIDVIKEASDAPNIAGGRLGIFNLKNRKIKYTEVTDEPNKIINKPLWGNKDNEVFILLGSIEEEKEYYTPKKILSYSNKNDILTDLNYNLNTENLSLMGNELELRRENEKLLLLGKTTKANNIAVSIDLNNRNMDIIENLHPFSINNESKKVIFKHLKDGKYLYILDKGIYISNSESSFLKFKSNDNVSAVYESPDNNRILIITNLKDNTELSIIDI